MAKLINVKKMPVFTHSYAPKENRDAEHEMIAKATEAFLKKGGTIKREKVKVVETPRKEIREGGTGVLHQCQLVLNNHSMFDLL
jgi:hypothetical protein